MTLQNRELTTLFAYFNRSSAGVTTLLKCLLVLSTLWHDMVQATLITSYCLQSQLLSLHVQSLRDKLLQHIISHGDWMRVSNIQYCVTALI
jgi:ribosome biogenesis protein ENP2